MLWETDSTLAWTASKILPSLDEPRKRDLPMDQYAIHCGEVTVKTMNTQQYLWRLLTYDQWANEEVLTFLERAIPPPSRSVRWLAHIIAAENLWLERIDGRNPTVVVWPDCDVEAVRAELELVNSRLQAYVKGLSDEVLRSSVQYKNSKGEPWKSTVEDILVHVTMHSAYHRGQIAADFRAAGLQPPYTDYIHAVRQGFLE